jgi:hypothetical protein
LLDSVPFIGAFLGVIGERLTEGSGSFKGVYEELSRVLVRAATGNAGFFLLVDDDITSHVDPSVVPHVPVRPSPTGSVAVGPARAISGISTRCSSTGNVEIRANGTARG